MIRTLTISDTTPGFVRTKDAEDLAKYANALDAWGAHHLSSTLKSISKALLQGETITIKSEP